MSDQLAAFAQLVEQEHNALARLNQLLVEEYAILRQRELERLETIADSKIEVISLLEQCERDRHSLLQSAGLKADKAGLEAMLDRDLSGELSRRWDALLEQLAACQRQNFTNGQIMEASRRNSQRILSILMGQGRDDRAQLYTARGATTRGRYSSTGLKV
jgi:flagellar biosynthesis/type III secretory pathway chaperone